MKNRDLIRDAMMFAVKDVTGRVLREATVKSMIDDFEKQLNTSVVSQHRELLIAFDTMREFDIKHDDIEESIDYFLKNKESYL